MAVTKAELHIRQKWTLEQKIDHSLGVIEAFVNRMGGLDKVYLSLSGGKDSTVLSHLARRLYPDILHVFINTGNEWPEVLQFVAKCEREGLNLVRLRPKMTPRQVWDKYGFPLASKEVSQTVYETRLNPNTKTAKKRLDRSNKFGLADKYLYMLTEPYSASHKCCAVLKKKPVREFEAATSRSPILGTMACESMLRETSYLRGGGV